MSAVHAEALAALTAHSVAAAAAEGQQRGAWQQLCVEAVLVSLPLIALYNDSAITQSLGPAIQAGIVPVLQVGPRSDACQLPPVRASQLCRQTLLLLPPPSGSPATPAPLSCSTVCRIWRGVRGRQAGLRIWRRLEPAQSTSQ